MKRELRIGNLVDFSGEIVEIDSIDGSGVYVDHKSMYLLYDEISPIKLNDEILQNFSFYKNGFTEHPNQKWRLDTEEGYFDLEKIIDYFLDDDKCHGTHIQYVHDLQNIVFALKREELIWKNTYNENN